LTSNDIAHKQPHGSNVHKGIGGDSKNTMYDESTKEGDNQHGYYHFEEGNNFQRPKLHDIFYNS
jgi:hypothetical protein